MSEQHLRMEGAREREKEREEREKERQAFEQLWDKEKNQNSAVTSAWVKQKLRQLIKQKNPEATSTLSSLPTGFRELAPIPDLNLHLQQNSSSSLNHRGEHLRRTVSEPLLKVKLRRSVTNRKNPLHRKSSAPPAGSCPSTLASERSSPSSQSDSGLLTYNTKLSHKSEKHLNSRQMASNPMSSSYVYVSPSQETVESAYSSAVFLMNNQRYLHTPVLTSPHPVQQVHFVVSPLRPLTRTQSQPAIIHLEPAPHMCRAYSTRQRERTRHTQEVSPGRQSQADKEGMEREKAKWRKKESIRRIDAMTKKSDMSEQKSVSCQLLTHEETAPKCYKSEGTEPPAVIKENRSTGLVYDLETQKPSCTCGGSNPHHGYHTSSVWSRLQECGLTSQCKRIPGRKATIQEIQVVPQENQAFPYGTNRLGRLNLADARVAAGSVTELALRVAQGELRNGFAIVKPRGHSTSHSESVGPFSSVAIAAKQLQNRLSDKKILIVDWDVHHNDIIQNVFYSDPKVLYISLHRHDLTPNPAKGGPSEVGLGAGEGFNVNVPWSGGPDLPIGDAEYLAAFRTVVLPIAQEFSPDVVLVSSEFNAVTGHPASSRGPRVSAECFGLLTQKLMDLARGRVVLVLEEGHDLMAICDASKMCINALLENKVATLSEDVLTKRPCAKAVKCLQKVLHIQSKYWRSVNAETHIVDQSWVQAKRRCSTDSDAASALASLSMAGSNSTRMVNSGSVFWNRHDQNEPMEHDENETYL
ncbi:histone deacetylase 7 isoform X2 [Salminus brasiliensis]